MSEKPAISKEELDLLEAQKAALVFSVTELKDKKDILTTEIKINTASLESLLGTIKQETDRLFETKAKYGKLYDEYQMLKNQYISLTDTYTQTKTAYTNTVEEQEREMATLQKKFNDAKFDLEQKINALKKEIANLEVSREASENKGIELNQIVKDATVKITTLKAQSASLVGDIAAKEAEVLSTQNTISVLQKTVSEKQTAISDNTAMINNQERVLEDILAKQAKAIEETKDIIKDKVALAERIKKLDEREEHIKQIYQQAGIEYVSNITV